MQINHPEALQVALEVLRELLQEGHVIEQAKVYDITAVLEERIEKLTQEEAQRDLKQWAAGVNWGDEDTVPRPFDHWCRACGTDLSRHGHTRGCENA